MRQHEKFMALLHVLHFPDDRLRKIAAPVVTFDDTLRTLVKNMAETMYHENGIGLAATQVDVHQQVIVIDLSEEKNNLLVVINPEIVKKEGETGIEEGCLSVPESVGFVPRAERLVVNAYNEYGDPFTIEADELLAICLQHEMDHLKGKLFVDYLSPLKRQRIEKKMLKLSKLESM